MSRCIPILYYGTEQGFNGGDDPNNRESLWPYMTQTHELYTFIKYLLQIRKNLTVNNWLKRLKSTDKQVPKYIHFPGVKFLLL